MAGRTRISDLDTAIMEELRKYGQIAAEEVKAAAKKVAKETAAGLRQTSPKATGEYAKGWGIKIRRETPVTIRITVHDKKYQLTHLLEKGHAKRGGGRTGPIPHIGPAEAEAAVKLEEEIRRRL